MGEDSRESAARVGVENKGGQEEGKMAVGGGKV